MMRPTIGQAAAFQVLLFILVLAFSLTRAGCCNDSCQRGDTYRDPQNRFEVVCPADDITLDDFGVTFFDAENSFNFLVRAYDTPPLHPEKPRTIGNVLSDIKSMIAQPGLEIRISREEPASFKNFKALDFDFSATSQSDGFTKFYYSRLVQADRYVFWLFFATLGGENAIVVTNENAVTAPRDIANRFFDGVKIR